MPETTDATFYRSPAEAIAAPPEKLAYVAAFDPAGQAKDAMAVLDTDPASPDYGQVVGWSELPTAGNELHHFGWNACSSALCHQGHNGHGPLERRYLIVPGIRSSRIYVLDTKPDPRNPKVVREITAEELAAKAGYSRPHTVHCGPGGIFLFNLGGANGNDGPGGVALLDHDTFDVIGAVGARPRRPVLRLRRLVAPQPRHRDHLRVGHPVDDRERPEPRGPARPQVRPPPELLVDVASASSPSGSTWATPTRWCSRSARPTTRPRPGGSSGWSSASRTCRGRCGCGTTTATAGRSVRSSPSPPSRPTPTLLPPALKPFGAVPPLVSDIDLSVDDRWLYVSCWGTGELKQYDVSDIFHPRETGSVRLGGIVGRQPHPAAPDQPLGGGPQMVEISRDGKPGLCHQLAVRGLGPHLLPRRGRRLGGQARRRPGRRRAQPPTRGSSPTATTSAGCGSTRPGCRAATPPATPTASPADHAPLGPPPRRGLAGQPAAGRRRRALAHGGRKAGPSWRPPVPG